MIILKPIARSERLRFPKRNSPKLDLPPTLATEKMVK